MNSKEAYEKGYIDGLTAYAWYYDGIRYVGKSGLDTLDKAIYNMRNNCNYDPPQED